MPSGTVDHLTRAKDYIAKGEDYYRKAAEEIATAKAERPELTWGEIGQRLGRSERWVRRLVAARADFLKTGEFEVDHESGSNKRDEVAQRVLRDPVQRRQVIESLSPEERIEIVSEVTRTAPQRGPLPEREGERDVWKSIQDAPDHDLSALAAKLVLTTSKIEVVLTEGGEFKRMGAKDLQRLDRDLERVKDTADRLKDQIAAQSRVRRIA